MSTVLIVVIVIVVLALAAAAVVIGRRAKERRRIERKRLAEDAESHREEAQTRAAEATRPTGRGVRGSRRAQRA